MLGKFQQCGRINILYHGICEDCDMENQRDSDYDDSDILERMAEEQADTAARCTCGAWQFSSKTGPFKVADCCCGAE